MPNHIINHLTITGNTERLQSFLEKVVVIEEGKPTMDFNKIIPMPESLNIEDGSNTIRGIKHYTKFMELFGKIPDANMDAAELDFLDMFPIDESVWELGKTAYNNRKLYGFETWYGWRVENWGTKWNAYGQDKCELNTEEGKILMTFRTAWASPFPIFERISSEYPDFKVHILWADEDLGYNCGSRTYVKGRVKYYYNPAERNSALRFAFKAWGLTPQEAGYRYNKETKEIEYIEE